MPAGQEILIATVDGTALTISIPAPSGGFPVGNGFQVNFVNDTQHLSTILAQSTQFAITQSNTTTSASAAPANTLYVFFFSALGAFLYEALLVPNNTYPFCTARQAPIPRRQAVLAI